MKVVFCTPTLTRPFDQYLDALGASAVLVIEAGLDEAAVYEIGCPYISSARATMLRKALDAKADVVVFIDHDLSWAPKDLLTLIESHGDVVAGTYRYKKEAEEYMGAVMTGRNDRPEVRDDGCIRAHSVPAGFLKITKAAVQRLMRAHPELIYGDPDHPSFDLFQHGAHQGVWYGEDMAFSRRWRELGGNIWIVPNLSITHHSAEKAYPGNYHRFLLRQPGGIDDPLRPRSLTIDT